MMNRPMPPELREHVEQTVDKMLDKLALAASRLTGSDPADVLTDEHREQVKDVVVYAIEHTTPKSFATLGDIFRVFVLSMAETYAELGQAERAARNPQHGDGLSLN